MVNIFKVIIANILFFPFYIYTSLQMRVRRINFYTEKETILKICEGYSIGRYGDGEINIVLKKSGIDFQDINEELAKRLLEILMLDTNGEKFCIALNPLIGTYRDYLLRQIRFWTAFNIKKRKSVLTLLKMDKYYDALFARMYGYKRITLESFNKQLHCLRMIWENRDLLIVEGKTTYFGVNNDLLFNAKSINRILIPSENAFDVYDEIFNSIKKYAMNKIVLLIAGPTATILAYDLYRNDIQAIDIGQINNSYELATKYVGESFKHNILTKDAYFSQIIDEII